MIILFSGLFPSSPEYIDYCKCNPKCDRILYDTSVSTATISDNFLQKLFLFVNDSHHLAEIRRIKDWVMLHTRNKSYTRQMYAIEKIMEQVYKNSIVLSKFALEDSKGEMLDLKNHIPSLIDDSPEFQQCFERNINIIIDRISVLNTTFEANYFIRFINEDSFAENFNVRVAHEVLRKTHHMDGLVKDISEGFTDYLSNITLIDSCFANLNETSSWYAYTPFLIQYIDYSISNISAANNALQEMYFMYQELYSMVNNDTKLQNIPPWQGGLQDVPFFK